MIITNILGDNILIIDKKYYLISELLASIRRISRYFTNRIQNNFKILFHNGSL